MDVETQFNISWDMHVLVFTCLSLHIVLLALRVYGVVSQLLHPSQLPR
jgi:hypothetical protein